MKPEEKPQEPLKTPCRRCEGNEKVASLVPGETTSAIGWLSSLLWCPACNGSGYEEKP